MAYYLIGAGGTGAKCINAFVHLCAAGLMPDADPVQVFFVDADTTNGNRSNTLQVIDYYQKAQRTLTEQNANLGANCPIFRTDIKYKYGDSYHNWNPLESNNYNLDQILQIGTLSPDYRNLYQILYPQEKRQATFQNGFLGWPSVGSAIISSNFEQLSSLTHLIANDQNAKVLLVGSIFGGTGAASIPTLAKLIKQSFQSQSQTSGRQSRSLGMILMLPYFMFDDSKGSGGMADSNPNIEPLNFALKTKIALQYYYSHGLHNLCSRIYLLGDSFNNKVADKKQIGGQNQLNKAHYLELYAGLSIIDFFGHTPHTQAGATPSHVYQETCRAEMKRINWSDLPCRDGLTQDIYRKLSRMISMAYVYNSSFVPILNSFRNNPEQSATQHPWYLNLIRDKFNLRESFVAVENLYYFNRQLLTWLSELHSNMENDPEPVEVNLVNSVSLAHYFAKDSHGQLGISPFEELSEPDYVNLLQIPNGFLPPPKRGLFQQTGFNLVRQNMSRHRPPAETSHLGLFLNALYNSTLHSNTQ